MKEEEVEQGKEREREREKKKKIQKKKKKIRETWLVRIEASINRLPVSLPLNRPTIWEIEDWS